MTEEKKLVAKDNNISLATQNKELLLQMQNSLGRDNIQPRLDFVPIIEVNNANVETETKEGRKIKVRCEPEFIVTIKNDDGEYITEKFGKEFKGVIVKVRYYVIKKYEEKDTLPFFKSYEFDSLKNDNIILVSSGQVIDDLPYREFVKIYKDKYVLYKILYVVIEGKLYKVKLKGASSWEASRYIRSFGLDDVVCAWYTKFSLEQEEKGDVIYNKLILEKDKPIKNLDDVLKYQKQLDTVCEMYKNMTQVIVEEKEEAVRKSVIDSFTKETQEANQMIKDEIDVIQADKKEKRLEDQIPDNLFN